MEIFIYAEFITPRLRYTFNFLNYFLAKGTLFYTNNAAEFKKANGIKINYSSQPVSHKEVWIMPCGLLYDNTLKLWPIQCFEWKQTKTFFKTESGDFPFDLLAAIFYLLSRYEEYLPFTPDKYGRFPAEQSWAYKENCLKQPLVNIWIEELKMLIQEKFLLQLPCLHNFQHLPTYDIDIAFKYQGRGWLRKLKGFGNKLFQPVLRNNNFLNDPYNVFNWLNTLHTKNTEQPVYFFLLALHRKAVDQNVSPNNKALQQLIIKQAQHYKVGIHPSFQSFENKKLLTAEIHSLQYILSKKVVHSRQHYLKMRLPETYEWLIENGIEKEFSMGYSTVNGFRASVALPFYWYNLKEEKSTSLKIFPFCFMDSASYFFEKQSAAEAFEEMKTNYFLLKKLNGLFITVFHNHFLTLQPAYKEWHNMYERFLKEIACGCFEE